MPGSVDPTTVSDDDHINDCDVAGRLFCGDSRHMTAVADNCV